MTNRRIILLAGLALLTQLFLVSVAQPQDRLEPLQDVRVQLKWTHQFQFAGYYAAIHKGYYRDAGLDVHLIEHVTGVTPVDQLIGGRVDFSVADAGVLLYRSTGVPLVALAAIFQNLPSVLITLEQSGIRELADLRGKRIMLQGGYLNAELMAMLQTAGIGSEGFELLPADTDIQALIDGRADAYNGYTTNEPFALKQRGIAHRIFAPSDYAVDFYGDILITTEGRIASDPEMVRRFLDATIKGWRYAVANPEEIVDLILREYNTQGRTREHLLFEADEAIRLILPHVVPIGYMNVERWQRIEDVFRAQGLLAQPVDMARFIHRSEDSSGYWNVLNHYRLEAAGLVAALICLGLVLHILRLRAQVGARTRDLENAKLRAEAEARTDALTGLPNRRYFLESLTRDIARAERHDTPLSILSMDIDHFKMVNDRFGHGAGDEALRMAGETISKQIRTGDVAARIGGEEFALSCLNSNVAETRNLAERLRSEIEGLVIDYEGKVFTTTVSVGLAFRESGDNVEQLLRKADQALYDAKETGRNRVCEWHPEIPSGDDPR